MFRNKSKIITILILTSFMFGCTMRLPQNNYKPTKTSLELQSIQKKEFDTAYKIAFSSTLSVFQDKGYIIATADPKAGFIAANSYKKSGVITFVGPSTDYIKATAFIEVMPSKRIAIRLNFVNHQEILGRYGNSVPIEDARFYQGIFESIQIAIFDRTGR